MTGEPGRSNSNNTRMLLMLLQLQTRNVHILGRRLSTRFSSVQSKLIEGNVTIHLLKAIVLVVKMTCQNVCVAKSIHVSNTSNTSLRAKDYSAGKIHFTIIWQDKQIQARSKTCRLISTMLCQISDSKSSHYIFPGTICWIHIFYSMKLA